MDIFGLGSGLYEGLMIGVNLVDDFVNLGFEIYVKYVISFIKDEVGDVMKVGFVRF